MRLRERDKREVTVHAFTGMEEDACTFAEGTAIRAAVYPMGTALVRQVYGESGQDARLMLYDGPERLLVGMGVSLSGGAPDYRIVRLEERSHVNAVLERIPKGGSL